MEELEASELGTLQYWENRYKKEIDNFSNHGDMGEIWFGEDIADKVILWMFKNIEKSCSIVDVGCGNGHILIELANEGYVDLTGLDYSEKAVNLAKAIAANKHFQIRYHVCDILKGLEHTYDIIHDKGTYDAISLSENSKESREMYIVSIKQALKPNGNFIITSCNWTHSELQEQYKDFFKLHYIIPTPQFMFGGKIGSVVSICVFKHVNN
ncbi:EEF1A lysine methyltransferase 2 [Sitophilus oryzae]|uniref:Protein-lysine N-methyltransferase LOC115886828 n=1 Tax=Sitophilus oryzae TaxID=7048 RepID=A0A6J2YFU3_SITOR|nr:EEF1A lysine methyltransferase 2 [Sitophilus oryzae]